MNKSMNAMKQDRKSRRVALIEMTGAFPHLMSVKIG